MSSLFMAPPPKIRSLIDNARDAARGDVSLAFQRIAAARRADSIKRGGWSSGDEAHVARHCLIEVRSRLMTFTARLGEILDAATQRLEGSDQQALLGEFAALRDELLQSLDRFLDAHAKNSVMTRNAQVRALVTERPKMSSDVRHEIELVLLRFDQERGGMAPERVESAPPHEDQFEKTKKGILAHRPMAIGLMMFVVIGGLASFWNDIREAYQSIFPSSDSPEVIHLRAIDVTQTPTPKRPQDSNRLPSLRVRFRDGRDAFVDAYFRIHIEPADAPRVHATTGPDYAAFLDTKIRAASFSVLEMMTLEQARTRRNEIRSEVMGRVTPTLKAAGFTLDDFGITEILEIGSR